MNEEATRLIAETAVKHSDELLAEWMKAQLSRSMASRGHC